MPQTQITSITCPNCKNNLPAWAQTCQFCGSPLKGVARPATGPIVDTWTDKPTWQEVAYIVVSVVWMLLGGWYILQGFQIVNVLPEKIGEGIGAWFKISGSISVVFGIGMLFQQLWAQFLVKWFSVLALVVSLWQIMTALMWASTTSKLVGGATVALNILLDVAYAAFYGFSIYIIKQVGDVDP